MLKIHSTYTVNDFEGSRRQQSELFSDLFSYKYLTTWGIHRALNLNSLRVRLSLNIELYKN